MRRSPEERFWAKVSKTDTCWLWTGYVTDKGYGQISKDYDAPGIRNGGSMVYAHRFSWELANGPIPPGLQVDHRSTCPKNCVRPGHLRLTTHKQNQENRRGAWARSASGVRGVSWHKRAKKWRVRVTHNREEFRGGLFDTIEEAAEAAASLRRKLFTHSDMDNPTEGERA